ncbi:MAG: ABC transporter permease, partial [Waterburya sp.]
VFPLIAASVVGVALLGFTLSYDEFTRTSLISGETNTLPLEIFGMTTNVTSPALYALGTLTTIFSFALIGIALFMMQLLSRRQAK